MTNSTDVLTNLKQSKPKKVKKNLVCLVQRIRIVLDMATRVRNVKLKFV